MATTIIIGGSGRAHSAIDNANHDASVNSWTQAQKDEMADLFDNFAKQVDTKRTAFNQA